MRATQIVKIRYSINTDGSTTAEEHNRIQVLTESGTGEGPKLVGTRNTGTENTYVSVLPINNNNTQNCK